VCEQYRIPKFSILTFVENACIHGIEKKSDGGRIDVIVMEEVDHLIIEIMDNGIGIKEEALNRINLLIKTASIEKVKEGNSIGIINSYLRLKMYYHEVIEFQIESKYNEGTEVYMVLPCDMDALEGMG